MTLSIWRYAHLALAILSSAFLIILSSTGVILAVDAINEKSPTYKVDNFENITLAQMLPTLRENYFEIIEIKVDHNNFVSIDAMDEDGNPIQAYINPTTGEKLVHKFFKVSPSFDGDKFFTIKNGIKMATPLFVALAVIEITDLVFSVDSIPAIFAIAPNDPFILYSSNIFAILGLRSLYFLLANSMDKFGKLHYGLAVILSFIGIKMIIMPFYHFDSTISLAIIGGILLITIIWSLLANKKAVS